MNCPKCSAEMEKVVFSNIVVDRCTGCQGLWFDLLEHVELKSIEGSEAIDTGDPEVGDRFDKIDDIDCPACGQRMIKMVDREQHHIWYESCPGCYGVFFDAGEFTDYKEDTFIDFIRDLFTRARD